MKKTLIFCFAIVALILTMNNTRAYSNESAAAGQAIENASNNIALLHSLEIPTGRANETLQEAMQIYKAQLALENTGVVGDYSVVFSDVQKIQNITQIAIKANDELKIFDDAYAQAKNQSDLSSMQQQYEAIQQSFKDQRFEDTLTLINQGYTSISDLQASQTALKLFYSATSNTLKSFLEDNWLKILIGTLVIVVLLVVFWTTLRKIRINSKIKHLVIEKGILFNLIKKMQTDYFKSKTLSEIEYKVKTERFKEMIRDIDRQIPLLKEELVKLDKKEASSLKKNKLGY